MRIGFSHKWWPRNVEDACRPDNSNIPFFSTLEEYDQRLRPDFPVGESEDRAFVWFVEPGVQSLEVYEAILAKTLHLNKSFRPLRKYISVAGVAQDTRIRHCSVGAGEGCRRRGPRDVCYTLMTAEESHAVHDWLWTREQCEGQGLRVTKCNHIVTPLGPVMLARFNPKARNAACRDLGFQHGEAAWQFPRSRLPPGMLMMGCAGVQAWALPEADGGRSDGRALRDTEDVVRVEWFRVERPLDEWWSTDENAERVNYQ